ncbi:NAD(P)-binding protein [Trametes gibbosa]|nr:NAD(P)-binding protein [Trametes gibbosa]
MSVFNASRLIGKTVLITGASAGIGAATAVLFAKGGSNVVLAARRVDALKSVAEACAAAHKESGLQQGGKFATVRLDVSDRKQIATFLEQVPEELRKIDILVNNAGFVLGTDRVGDISQDDLEAMFSVNVFGLIAVTQLFIKGRQALRMPFPVSIPHEDPRADFKARKTGHIINIGSIAGREPYAGGSIYCATKHAVRAFSGALLREVVDTPIRVTEIQPGMVETEFSVVRFRGDKSAADKVYEGLQPLIAEDIAEEIVWAASRPPHINIAELFVLPVNQASPTINYRGPK